MKKFDIKLSFVTILFFLCFASSAVSAAKEQCTSLAGVWYNELGSRIELNQSQNTQLIGKYWTAVERTNGTLTTNHSDIIGTVTYKEAGSVFGFSVMWRDGQAMTLWTGQCVVCGDEEVLETSWLLRSRVDDCLDKWKSTLIGQNTFTHTQQIVMRQNIRRRRSTSPDEVSYDYQESTSKSRRNVQGKPACSLDGYWYNALGSEMMLTTHRANNSVTGEYRTAVERCKGAAGSSHAHVYGLNNSTQLGASTISLFVVWNNGQSVTGWVGQCHTCGVNGSEVLLMTWLLRSQIDSCDDNWKATNYGETVFTRHEQVEGPRKSLGTHTPGQAGETARAQRQTATCSADVNVSTAFVVLLSLFFFIFI